MALTKVLVTVKTYPTLSKKYDELVCTAGFKEDGSWIRIYPLPFRKLEYGSRYSKYQWIEIDLKRNTSDPRPESYKPVNFEQIGIREKIGTDGGYWSRRRKIVLKKVHRNLSSLIVDAKDSKICTSLAVFKPKEITDFKIEKTEREWNPELIAFLEAKGKQLNLFSNSDNPFAVVNKVPYKFSYKFVDENNISSTLKIEDWEIGQLYWNLLKKYEGNEDKACKDVRKKYFDDFAKTKDLYLFLGTTREFHFVAPNPFIIIGTFHPKIKQQMDLF